MIIDNYQTVPLTNKGIGWTQIGGNGMFPYIHTGRLWASLEHLRAIRVCDEQDKI